MTPRQIKAIMQRRSSGAKQFAELTDAVMGELARRLSPSASAIQLSPSQSVVEVPGTPPHEHGHGQRIEVIAERRGALLSLSHTTLVWPHTGICEYDVQLIINDADRARARGRLPALNLLFSSCDALEHTPGWRFAADGGNESDPLSVYGIIKRLARYTPDEAVDEASGLEEVLKAPITEQPHPEIGVSRRLSGRAREALFLARVATRAFVEVSQE